MVGSLILHILCFHILKTDYLFSFACSGLGQDIHTIKKWTECTSSHKEPAISSPKEQWTVFFQKTIRSLFKQ